MSNFIDCHDRVGSNPDKFFKSTLFQSSHLLIGLNCLEPGQTQNTHTHTDQDKFYFVIEGMGEFVVGEETKEAGVGCIIWASAGAPHGVTNAGEHRLVLLVGIAPEPKS